MKAQPIQVIRDFLKEYKETEIVQNFLVAYARQGGGVWKVLEHSEPLKPDFLVIGENGNREHIEVTVLYPSAEVGRQESLCRQLDGMLDVALLKDRKYRGLSLIFEKFSLPSQRFLRSHVEKVILQIDQVLREKGRDAKWAVRVNVDGCKFDVKFSPTKNSEPRCGFRLDADREAYLQGLQERIAEKAGSVYELEYPAKLVIYDNTAYSISSLDDVVREAVPYLEQCPRGQFKEVWLLSSEETVFRIL